MSHRGQGPQSPRGKLLSGRGQNVEVRTAADEEAAIRAATGINDRTRRNNREHREAQRLAREKGKIVLPKFSWDRDRD